MTNAACPPASLLDLSLVQASRGQRDIDTNEPIGVQACGRAAAGLCTRQLLKSAIANKSGFGTSLMRPSWLHVQWKAAMTTIFVTSPGPPRCTLLPVGFCAQEIQFDRPARDITTCTAAVHGYHHMHRCPAWISPQHMHRCSPGNLRIYVHEARGQRGLAADPSGAPQSPAPPAAHQTRPEAAEGRRPGNMRGRQVHDTG